MSDPITFSTAAFGGFEKKQVLDYIYELHEEADQTQAKYKKKLEEISVAFKDLEERALAAEREVTSLQQQLEVAEQKVTQERERQEAATKKLEEQQSQIEQYERILAQQKTEIPAPIPSTNPVVVQKEEDMEEEFKRLEESSVQIGRVMLDAHTKADQIVHKAKKEANAYITQAQTAMEAQRTKINQALQEQKKAIQVECEEKLARTQRLAEERIADADQYAQRVMEDITLTAGETTRHMEMLQTQLDELTQVTETTFLQIQRQQHAKLTESKIGKAPTSRLKVETEQRKAEEQASTSTPKEPSVEKESVQEKEKELFLKIPEPTPRVVEEPILSSLDIDSFQKELETDFEGLTFTIKE